MLGAKITFLFLSEMPRVQQRQVHDDSTCKAGENSCTSFPDDVSQILSRPSTDNNAKKSPFTVNDDLLPPKPDSIFEVQQLGARVERPQRQHALISACVVRNMYCLIC